MTKGQSSINTQERDTYWNAFPILDQKEDVYYHLAGADKQAEEGLASMLYYTYRFAIEKGLLGYFLGRYGQTRNRALDCGAGTGRISLHLADYFDKVDSFDISEPMIEENKRRFAAYNNIHFFSSDFDTLSLENTYDCIFVGGVFMCMSDEEVRRALVKIRSMLADGGVLIVRDSLSKTHTKQSSAIKIYRNQKDYEQLFSASGFSLKQKTNSANRNIWCSIFMRLPHVIQKPLFPFFSRLIQKTIRLDVQKAAREPFVRHPMSNQLFYIFSV